MTNYIITNKWYTVADGDVLIYADGPYAIDLNITCIPKTGNIQLQIKDDLGNWFTPAEASYTILESGLIRIPRANMPEMRILPTLDATFAVHGDP